MSNLNAWLSNVFIATSKVIMSFAWLFMNLLTRGTHPYTVCHSPRGHICQQKMVHGSDTDEEKLMSTQHEMKPSAASWQ